MNYRTSSLGLVMLGLWGCSGGTANPLGQGGTTGVSPGTGGASNATGGNAASGGATTASGGSTASGGATSASGGSSALPTGGMPGSGGASTTNNTGGSMAGAATGGSGSPTGGATAAGGSAGQNGGSTSGGSTNGGTTAAGGSTSAGGAAGGGAAGGTAGGASGACPTGALFCEDFEKYSPGAAKAANGWTPETNSGSLQIDTTHARGKQALHVHTDGKGRAFIKLSPFSPPGNSFYGRMHLWVTAFPTAPNYAHYTLVELTGTGNDSIVRPIGGQFIQDQSANMWGPGNDKGATGDWTNWKPSAKAESGKWLCMEWQMSAANNEIKIWINSEAKTDLTVNTKSHGGNSTDFVFPTFNNIWFGWWLYQDGPTPNMFDLWIDDIALSSDRLGCQ